MHGVDERSLAPRLTATIGHLSAVLVAAWILLGDGAEIVAGRLGWSWESGDLSRRVVLLALSVIYLARVTLGFSLLLKRRFGWGEAAPVLSLFVALHLTFALLGGTATAPLSWLDAPALALYAIGSYLNSGAEYGRYRWKQRPDSRGRLYTEGLFRYAMHINYFGDTVLFIGFALVTRSAAALVIPALMTAGFVFQHIPALDTYLAGKYGEQFADYAKRTKKLVPFVY